MPTHMTWTRKIAAAAFAVAVAVGCSPQVKHTASEVVTLKGPQVAPKEQVIPTGKPVLTLIDGDEHFVFDLAGLERLGLAESRLYEPYLKEDLTFEGVPTTDLVAYLGLQPTDTVLIVALDKFEVTTTVADLLASKALIATHSQGREIPIADGGPTRVVFPGDPLAADMDMWIWSLDTLTISRG